MHYQLSQDKNIFSLSLINLKNAGFFSNDFDTKQLLFFCDLFDFFYYLYTSLVFIM